MRYLFYGDELFFYLLKETISIDVEKIDKIENFDFVSEANFEDVILIADNNIFNSQEAGDSINLSGFSKILVFSDRIDTEFYKNHQNLKNKIEFHKRDEYIYIENFVSAKNSTITTEKSKVILSDSFKDLVTPLENIEYFSYDRNLKKSFAIVNGKPYFLRKSLAEIEKAVENTSFIRVERSIILNLNQIKEIDYKEEFILTNSSEKIYLGKSILKKISENYFSSLFRL